TRPAYSSARASTTGVSCRQGAHHSAQKSTSTVPGACSTSRSQSAVVRTCTLSLKITSAARPDRVLRLRRGTRPSVTPIGEFYLGQTGAGTRSLLAAPVWDTGRMRAGAPAVPEEDA